MKSSIDATNFPAPARLTGRFTNGYVSWSRGIRWRWSFYFWSSQIDRFHGLVHAFSWGKALRIALNFRLIYMWPKRFHGLGNPNKNSGQPDIFFQWQIYTERWTDFNTFGNWNLAVIAIYRLCFFNLPASHSIIAMEHESSMINHIIIKLYQLALDFPRNGFSRNRQCFRVCLFGSVWSGCLVVTAQGAGMCIRFVV